MGYIDEAYDRIELAKRHGSSALKLSLLLLTDKELEELMPKIIEDLPDLKELDLGQNWISIFPDQLAKLEKLEALILCHNSLTDIAPLAKLTRLNHLELGFNFIEDISPIAQLTELTVLQLNNNKLDNISPIAALKKLDCLELNDNQLSDISPIEHLTNLRILFLDDNNLENVSPLAKLKKIQFVDLSFNNLIQIAPFLELNLISEGDVALLREKGGLTDAEIIEVFVSGNIEGMLAEEKGSIRWQEFKHQKPEKKYTFKDVKDVMEKQLKMKEKEEKEENSSISKQKKRPKQKQDQNRQGPNNATVRRRGPR